MVCGCANSDLGKRRRGGWLKKKLEKHKLPKVARNAAEEIRLNHALLRFYYRGNPEKWSNDKYAKMVKEMEFVFEYMGLHNKIM